jgi:hypothetical protein
MAIKIPKAKVLAISLTDFLSSVNITMSDLEMVNAEVEKKLQMNHLGMKTVTIKVNTPVARFKTWIVICFKS